MAHPRSRAPPVASVTLEHRKRQAVALHPSATLTTLENVRDESERHERNDDRKRKRPHDHTHRRRDDEPSNITCMRAFALRLWCKTGADVAHRSIEDRFQIFAVKGGLLTSPNKRHKGASRGSPKSTGYPAEIEHPGSGERLAARGDLPRGDLEFAYKVRIETRENMVEVVITHRTNSTLAVRKWEWDGPKLEVNPSISVPAIRAKRVRLEVAFASFAQRHTGRIFDLHARSPSVTDFQ